LEGIVLLKGGRALMCIGVGVLLLRPAFGQAAADSSSLFRPPDAMAGSDLSSTVFFSGRVAVDDGAVPETTGVVEVVCGRTRRGQAYTDSKGRFTLVLGRSAMTMADASAASSPGFFGLAAPATCEVQATIPGYRSEAMSVPEGSLFNSPDLGTIFIHRFGASEGGVVSITTLAAPKNARRAFEKGRRELMNKKPAEALKEFQRAVDLYPEYSVAWCELGRLQMEAKRADAAAASFRTAIKADARVVPPYLYLSLLQARAGQWNESAATSKRALALDPYNLPEAYVLNAIANYNTGHLDAAEKSARAAERIDADHRRPKAWLLLGIILEERREYAAAADQLRLYLQYAPDAEDRSGVEARLAEIATTSEIASSEGLHE
jgi:Tfp pilus assembly protein PilF